MLVVNWILYILFFLKELLFSSISVTKTVLFPKGRVCPGIVKVPLDLKSDLGITILANTITLTPGTLSLDVSSDKKFLYVHALCLDPADRDQFVASIKNDFEKKVFKLLRKA